MHFKVSTETPSLSNWIKLMCDSFPDAKITVYIYIGGGNSIIEAVLPVLKGGEVMTKQEKIKEELAQRLYNRDVKVLPIAYPLDWDKLPQITRDGYYKEVEILLAGEPLIGETMSKQEKIREGIATRLEIAYNTGLSKRTCNSNEMARQAVAQLHSQGVVVKVDRKLPYFYWSYEGSDNQYHAYMNSEKLYSHPTLREVQMFIAELKVKAGLVAVDPLVKEG